MAPARPKTDEPESTATVEAMGVKASFPARHAGSLISALILAVVVGIGAMLRDHDLKQTEQLRAAVLARDVQLAKAASDRDKQLTIVINGQISLQGAMNDMIYVLSLDPAKRSQLKIEMPSSMRDRLLNQERPFDRPGH